MDSKRMVLIILDSAGVGELPDAGRFNDQGAHTIGNISRERGFLDLKNLCSLGLGRIADIGCAEVPVTGCYGKMAERSVGKDTTTGHWEIAGLVTEKPFPTYPKGFPTEIIRKFEERIHCKTLGNYPRSGTVILEELGEEHLKTGFPIVYTSADSVFQIAAHEEAIPLERLYEYCLLAREILVREHSVARVIARPFTGSPGSFTRNNAGRRDYSIEPSGQTLLDYLKNAGLISVGIGKIGSIFGHRGFTQEIPTKDNRDGLDQILKAMAETETRSGLIFANLVDFDMVYGHRRDVEGYAQALESFDRRLPQIMEALNPGDILMISADHGCDPTFKAHTDHTREYVPLLVYGKGLNKGVDLGTRSTFADCGQTIAEVFGVGPLAHGAGFKKDLIDD